MQALFLLAGENNRFYPLNTDRHKAMTSLYGKPLVSYAVEAMKQCGISEFIFVIGVNGESVRTYFANRTDISVQFVTQEKPEGQGDAILAAAAHIKEPFIIPNPYHIEKAEVIKGIIETFHREQADSVIPAMYEERINDYGALVLDGKRIRGIVEKPAPGEEPSHYRATSAYIFRPDFLDYLRSAPKDHYSYELAITAYAKDHHVFMHELGREHAIVSLKYSWHLLPLRKAIADMSEGYISPAASIAPTAVIDPLAYIDEGARISDGAHIIGKTYIGKNAFIGNHAVIRDSDIGEHTQIGIFSDVTRSIIMSGSHSHGGGFIGDSVIGPDCRLAHGFVAANKRLDRKEITCYIRGKAVRTNTESLGVIMGKGVRTGVRVSVMPGVLIGNAATIMSGAIVYRNVDDNALLDYRQS